jgi:hypothetical protein
MRLSDSRDGQEAGIKFDGCNLGLRNLRRVCVAYLALNACWISAYERRKPECA